METIGGIETNDLKCPDCGTVPLPKEVSHQGHKAWFECPCGQRIEGTVQYRSHGHGPEWIIGPNALYPQEMVSQRRKKELFDRAMEQHTELCERCGTKRVVTAPDHGICSDCGHTGLGGPGWDEQFKRSKE